MATPEFEVLVETFAFLEEWEDRYRHLIELGKAMAPLDPALKGAVFKVSGCASQVWIVPVIEAGVFSFQGDSDALIVKGLIAVLYTLYAGLPVASVRHVDAAGELVRLGLQDHLSAQRSNGLRAMVERIRTVAAG